MFVVDLKQQLFPGKTKPLTPALDDSCTQKSGARLKTQCLEMASVVECIKDGLGGRMGRRIAKDIGGKSGNEHSLGNSTTTTMHTRSTHIRTTHQPELNPACTYAIEAMNKFGVNLVSNSNQNSRPKNHIVLKIEAVFFCQPTSPCMASHPFFSVAALPAVRPPLNGSAAGLGGSHVAFG